MKIRYVLIALLVLVVLVLGGLAYVSSNVDSFRPRIQAELQQKLNRPVTIGHLGLRWFPLSIRIDGFSIGEDPAFGSSPAFAQANQVFVSVGLFSLIGGNPQVEDVVLDQPRIELIRNAQNKWNFSTLGGSSSSSGGNSKFTLDKLQINDGQVALTDMAHHEPRSVYDHIDLKVSDFAQNKKFPLELAVHLPGEGKQLAEFKGNIGPLAEGSNTSLPPVAGHVTLDQVSLAAVNRFAAGALPAQTDSTITGNTDIDTSGGKIGAKGDLKFSNTTVRGAKIEYPIQTSYDVTSDQAFNRIAIKSANLDLGGTKFDASGTLDNASKPAQLDMQVKTNDSSITELAKMAGAMGLAFNPQYKVDGRLSVNLTAKGPTTSPQLNGTIKATNVSASGGEIKEPVSTPEIDLTLTPQSIVSNNFSAKSGSTALNVAFTLTGYTTRVPVADISLRANNAQIAELLNIAKAYGITAAQGVTGTGMLSIDVHAHGDTAHPNALVYAGSGSIQNATLTTPELTKPLLIHSANAQFSQNSVALSNLSATIASSTLSGTLSAKDFTAPNVQFALSADKIDTDEMENLVTPSSPKAAAAKTSNEPGLLQTSTGGGTLAVGTLKAQQIVLTKVSTKVALNHGLVTLSPLNANAFGGSIAGSLNADMRPKVPQCSVNAKLSGMDANAVLSAVSTMKNELYGSLGANTNLRFALASSNDLARTLNGTVQFAITNGELKNVNILNEISKVSRFLGSAPSAGGGSSTQLKQFSGTLNIADGVANTTDLKAATADGSLAANGSLSLVSQALNMHMLASIGKNLTVPVLVGGTTAHMSFTPDMSAISKMKLGGNSVQGLVGGLLGQKPAQQTNNNKQQKNGLNSILNQLIK